MRKTLLFIVLAALLVPAAALAKGKPTTTTTSNGHKGGKSAPKVMYVLTGSLSGYQPYDSSTQTNGMITIAVKHSNYHGKALKNTSITLAVGAKTKITLENGVTAITDNDNGTVKIKAAKKVAAADLVATLQAGTAAQVIDRGAPSSS